MDKNVQEDRFEDLDDLEPEVLVRMSKKDKKDLRLTRRINKTLDWILGIAIGVSAIGFGIYSLAPEQINQLYNSVTDNINSLYQPKLDSYSETSDSLKLSS